MCGRESVISCYFIHASERICERLIDASYNVPVAFAVSLHTRPGLGSRDDWNFRLIGGFTWSGIIKSAGVMASRSLHLEGGRGEGWGSRTAAATDNNKEPYHNIIKMSDHSLAWSWQIQWMVFCHRRRVLNHPSSTSLSRVHERPVPSANCVRMNWTNWPFCFQVLKQTPRVRKPSGTSVA